MDLLNEVLKIDFDQEAAKISVKVKVGGKKNICRSAGLNPKRPELAEYLGRYFFSTSNFDL